MLSYGLPVFFALFLWWFSTGAILAANRQPRLKSVTLMVATALMIASIVGLIALRQDTTTAGAYLGFVCALGLWGWNEIAFLTGFITGPNRRDCPPDFAGLKRLAACTEMVIHHELAILLTGVAVAAVSLGADNQVGLTTFLVLWLMRLSSKLNLYLGVANAPVSFLPGHLAFMASAFRQRALNPLLPVSIIVGLALTGLFLADALAPEATSFEIAEGLLLATITALAVIEHLFFVLPIPSERLWNWYRRTDPILPRFGANETVLAASTISKK